MGGYESMCGDGHGMHAASLHGEQRERIQMPAPTAAVAAGGRRKREERAHHRLGSADEKAHGLHHVPAQLKECQAEHDSPQRNLSRQWKAWRTGGRQSRFPALRLLKAATRSSLAEVVLQQYIYARGPRTCVPSPVHSSARCRAAARRPTTRCRSACCASWRRATASRSRVRMRLRGRRS